MFLSFLAVILMCCFVGSLLFLLETIMFICVFKRKVASDCESDSVKKIKKRLSIYRRQRKINIIISIVLLVSFIAVGVIGVYYA